MIDSPLFLLALLAALVAVPLVLRRARAGTEGAVRVLGRTAVHKGAVLAVVAVGPRRLLVGTGERGVHLLAELDPAEEGAAPHGAITTTVTTTASAPVPDPVPRTPDPARTDASGVPPSDLAALLGAPGSSVLHEGPRIGLVDRLRAMTVRVPVRGRPIDVLRR